MPHVSISMLQYRIYRVGASSGGGELSSMTNALELIAEVTRRWLGRQQGGALEGKERTRLVFPENKTFCHDYINGKVPRVSRRCKQWRR